MNPQQRSITALDNKPSAYVPSSHTTKISDHNNITGGELLSRKPSDRQKNVPLALGNSRFNRASVDDLRVNEYQQKLDHKTERRLVEPNQAAGIGSKALQTRSAIDLHIGAVEVNDKSPSIQKRHLPIEEKKKVFNEWGAIMRRQDEVEQAADLEIQTY